jgi:hypothetical protein
MATLSIMTSLFDCFSIEPELVFTTYGDWLRYMETLDVEALSEVPEEPEDR